MNERLTKEEQEIVINRTLFEAAATTVVQQFSDARLAGLAELSSASLLKISMAHFREARNRLAYGEDRNETRHIIREGIGAAMAATSLTMHYGWGDAPQPQLSVSGTLEEIDAVYARASELAADIIDEYHADSMAEIGSIAYLELAISRLRWVTNQMTGNSKYSPVEHLLLALNGIAAAVLRYEQGDL